MNAGDIDQLPKSITDLNLAGTNLEGEAIYTSTTQGLISRCCPKATPQRACPRMISTSYLSLFSLLCTSHSLSLLLGTLLALASCQDLVHINFSMTKMLCPIPIDEQHSFVQELSGNTLTREIMNSEAKRALKEAFLKFIGVSSEVISTCIIYHHTICFVHSLTHFYTSHQLSN